MPDIVITNNLQKNKSKIQVELMSWVDIVITNNLQKNKTKRVYELSWASVMENYNKTVELSGVELFSWKVAHKIQMQKLKKLFKNWDNIDILSHKINVFLKLTYNLSNPCPFIDKFTNT